MIRLALDTNVLIYLIGVAKVDTDTVKIDQLQELRRKLTGQVELIIPVQAVGEFANVLMRSGFSRSDARQEANELTEAMSTSPTMASTMATALVLVDSNHFQIWDAVIIAASIEAGCSMLLSEDMQHGYTTQGLTIVNPLADPMHPRLAALL